MKTRKKMTLAELDPIIADYLNSFVGWDVHERDTIFRHHDAVVQQIGFERLRTGEYRPVGGVRVLTTPNHAGLHRFLDMSVRSIEPSRHAESYPRVEAAMLKQFEPSISQPLTINAVVAAFEREAVLTQHDRCALATLNGYIGDEEKARFWCSKFESEIESCERPLAQWEIERSAEIESLKRWLDAGIAVERLQEVIRSEQHRLGIES